MITRNHIIHNHKIRVLNFYCIVMKMNAIYKIISNA